MLSYQTWHRIGRCDERGLKKSAPNTWDKVMEAEKSSIDFVSKSSIYLGVVPLRLLTAFSVAFIRKSTAERKTFRRSENLEVKVSRMEVKLVS